MSERVQVSQQCDSYFGLSVADRDLDFAAAVIRPCVGDDLGARGTSMELWYWAYPDVVAHSAVRHHTRYAFVVLGRSP